MKKFDIDSKPSFYGEYICIDENTKLNPDLENDEDWKIHKQALDMVLNEFNKLYKEGKLK